MTRGDMKIGGWWASLGALAAVMVIAFTLLYNRVEAQAVQISALQQERATIVERLEGFQKLNTAQHDAIMKELQKARTP